MNDPGVCKMCGAYREWEDCGDCGGDGYVDVFEDNPQWYSPGDTEDCHQCGGNGGWWVCPNAEQHSELQAAAFR